jgi:hypothetical protein
VPELVFIDNWLTCWYPVGLEPRLVDAARGCNLDTFICISVFSIILSVETNSGPAVDGILPLSCVKGVIRSISKAKLDARMLKIIGRL